MARPRRSLLLFAALLSSALLGGAADTGGLAQNSPFMPPAEKPPAPPEEKQAIELRGIMGEGDEATFIIYNPTARESSWLKKGSEVNKISFVSFDTGSERLTVKYQGRTIGLNLPEAKIGTASAPIMAPPPSGPQISNPQGVSDAITATVKVNPTPADEAQRLQAVAAEIRRRRALRQAQSGGATN